MPLQRLYIYRCGTTNACALTREKGDPRLPAPLAPDRWQFWMQTGCHQTDNALYGFALETAQAQIAARGVLPFHRLNQTARSSHCRATLNTKILNHI
jgi:hypothetical protein